TRASCTTTSRSSAPSPIATRAPGSRTSRSTRCRTRTRTRASIRSIGLAATTRGRKRTRTTTNDGRELSNDAEARRIDDRVEEPLFGDQREVRVPRVDLDFGARVFEAARARALVRRDVPEHLRRCLFGRAGQDDALLRAQALSQLDAAHVLEGVRHDVA